MKKILNNPYIILIPILILNLISLIYLHNTPYFNRQLIYISISYIILFIISKINYHTIFKYIKYLYYLSIILLIIVLIFGKEAHGAKAWLQIFNISIQPSEIAKLSLLIYLTYLTLKNKSFIHLLILTIIPSILTFLEPDTGAIIFYLIILLTTIKYLKISSKKLITIISIITIIILLHITIYITNKNLLINIYGPKIFYRIDRLISFKEQNNIQNINSLISIGSHNLLYIPENHNDLIFASIISKYHTKAFITIIISFFLIIYYYIYHLDKRKNISNIYNNIVLNMLTFQIFYNILMNLSLIPIMGIPLPFLSYGGSYLITLYFIIGLSINLISNNKV